MKDKFTKALSVLANPNKKRNALRQEECIGKKSNKYIVACSTCIKFAVPGFRGVEIPNKSIKK